MINPSRLQATVPPWTEAVAAVVGQYAEVSATLAADFYDAERAAAEAPGVFTVPLADAPSDEQVTASMRWATKDVWDRAPELATAAQSEPVDIRLDAAFTKADMATQKLVADVGRETVRQAVRQDREAVAYARVAALGACSFCKLLASRGSVYATAQTAGRDANDRFSGDASVVKFHDNCVPAGTLVDGPTAEVGYRRWYEGEMLVIGTAAGHQLSITPNHPVLTDRGWIPAGLLRPGDHVISSLNAQGSLLQVPDEEHVPARIENVWCALSVLGLVSVPVASEDFHGDGADGEVDVVRADGLLRNYSEAVASQVLADVELTLACVREILFALLGSPEQFFGGDFATAGSVVSSLCKAETLLVAQLGQSVGLGVASIADRSSGLKQGAPDGVSADLVALRERQLALAIEIGGDDAGRRQIGPVGSSWNATLAKLTREHRCGDSTGSRNLGSALACEVELDSAIEFGSAGSVRPMRFDPRAFTARWMDPTLMPVSAET
ncbi:Hint domain-containing protein [Streptomyces stelliscabiei]|uniref:Hint domain-containing protein n=1 Tax=Streptomyces stelliscabiei TaxID=146820 RepID=UPI002FF3F4C4